MSIILSGSLDNGDSYAAAPATAVAGGWMSVPDAAARLALASFLRVEGMVVYQRDTDVEYQLAADLTTWNVHTVADATTSTKGIVQLAQDLGGTATAPTVVAATGTGGVLPLRSGLASVTFDKGTSSPSISQVAKDTDTAPQSFTDTPQGPWASATGTNRNPGNRVFNIPSPAAGGAQGFYRWQWGGATKASFGFDGTNPYAEWAPSGAATKGIGRYANNTVAAVWRNQAGTDNIGAIYVDASDVLQIGGYSIGDWSRVAGIVHDGGYHRFNITGSPRFIINDGANDTWQPLHFQAAGFCRVKAKSASGDVASDPLDLLGGAASATATGTNKDGAPVRLSSGSTTDTAGRRRILEAWTSIDNGLLAHEICDVGQNQTSMVSVWFNGGRATTTDYPAGSGDSVHGEGPCTTEPTANPGSGRVVRYTTGGEHYRRTSGGLVQSLAPSRATRAFPSDANYTAVLADYRATSIEVTGTLTAQRNFVVPIAAGFQWTFFNNTSGGFGVQVIGATGTGVVVAAGKRAILEADGTNIVRVTPDT